MTDLHTVRANRRAVLAFITSVALLAIAIGLGTWNAFQQDDTSQDVADLQDKQRKTDKRVKRIEGEVGVSNGKSPSGQPGGNPPPHSPPKQPNRPEQPQQSPGSGGGGTLNEAINGAQDTLAPIRDTTCQNAPLTCGL